MIERFLQHADAIARHTKVPMLAEREAYLNSLLSQGRKRRSVAECASTLCYVVDLLDSINGRVVTEDVISEALHRWIMGSKTDPQQVRHLDTRQFKAVARSWSKFLGQYAPRDRGLGSFGPLLDDFVTVRKNAGYRVGSIRTLTSPVRLYLVWAHRHALEISSTCQARLDTYFAERRVSGCSARTLASQCTALRVFLKYAEQRGLLAEGVSERLTIPRYKDFRNATNFPSWRRIRQTIAAVDGQSHSEIRARPILLLAAVYGLRCAEIIRLTLEDLDWYNEVLTVQRAKRGRIQQFPLQHEVGEAIIRYLEVVRPPCSYRNLFVTLKTPYRPVENLGPAMRKVLRAHGLTSSPCGLHALRHACATELLRKGSSLRRIADFLGHRSMRSVSIYARSDIRALRKVADVELKKVL